MGISPQTVGDILDMRRDEKKTFIVARQCLDDLQGGAAGIFEMGAAEKLVEDDQDPLLFLDLAKDFFQPFYLGIIMTITLTDTIGEVDGDDQSVEKWSS